MKKLILTLTALFVLFRVSAALPYFDPFADATANGGTTYAPGSLAAQKNNATNIWNAVGTMFAGTEPLITAGSLNYASLPAGTGNSVTFGPDSAKGDRLNFNAIVTNGAVYYSYLLKLTNISAVPTNAANNYFAGFSDGSVGQTAQLQRAGTRVVTKATGTGGFVLGVARNGTPADYVYDTTVHNTNEVIFIVGSYELVGGVTNVNLWINPSSTTFGTTNVPTPTVSAVHYTSVSGALNAGGVQGYVILNQNTNAPAGVLDELRIATNWSDVTGGNPSILTQPANVIRPSGNTVMFTVNASGTAPLSYQWYKDGNPLSDGGNISGSASATLTVGGIGSGDVGNYYVIVTNGGGNTAQSSSASLALLTDPLITAQPQGTNANYGGNVSFTVTATGTATINYLWHEQGVGDLSDGGNISGSQTATLTLSGVSSSDAGQYYVTVSNGNGSVDSANATLAVNDPYFSTQPVSTSVATGATATFTAIASGSGSLVYQWFKAGNYVFDSGNVSGTGTSTLTIADCSAADQTNYFCVVSGASTATSSVVNLTVLSPVGIASEPLSRTVAAGVRVAFSVGATGSTPLSYQWLADSSPIAGATVSSLVLSNVPAGATTNFQVTVSNAFSSITSSVAVLTVATNITLSQSNLIVLRVGDGAQTLNLTGNSIYLDQYTASGAYVNTVTIPDNGPSALVDVGQDNATGVNTGATTGSGLTLSLDSRFMVIAGYNTNLTSTAVLGSSTGAAIPRGVGLIDSTGTVQVPVLSTNSVFDNTYWRAAISDGTNNYWGGGGAGGTYYFGFDAPAVVVQTTMVNMRSMSLYNGDIYCAGAQTGAIGVVKISGMPRTATNGTLLFTGSTGTFDMAVNPAGNLIYVVDQRALSAGGGIQRWDFDGANWNLTYTLQVGGLGAVPHGPRYITADFSGANPVLFVTSNDNTFDNNGITSVVDAGSGSTGTQVAVAGVNATFRGIHFGPIMNTVVPRPVLNFTAGSSALILNWTGSASLQAAPNATGTYTNVLGATSPYTNDYSAAPQQFFRLAQ